MCSRCQTSSGIASYTCNKAANYCKMKTKFASLVLLLLLIGAASSSAKRHHGAAKSKPRSTPPTAATNATIGLATHMIRLGMRLLAWNKEKNFVFSPLMALASLNMIASQASQQIDVSAEEVQFVACLAGTTPDGLGEQRQLLKHLIGDLWRPPSAAAAAAATREAKPIAQRFVLDAWNLILAQNLTDEQLDYAPEFKTMVEQDFRGQFEALSANNSVLEKILVQAEKYRKEAHFKHNLIEGHQKGRKPSVSIYQALRVEANWVDTEASSTPGPTNGLFAGKKHDFIRLLDYVALQLDDYNMFRPTLIRVNQDLRLLILSPRTRRFDAMQQSFRDNDHLEEALEKSDSWQVVKASFRLPVMKFETHLDLDVALDEIYKAKMAKRNERRRSNHTDEPNLLPGLRLFGTKVKNFVQHNKFEVSLKGINSEHISAKPESPAKPAPNRAHRNPSQPKQRFHYDWWDAEPFWFILLSKRVPILMGRCSGPSD